MLDAESAACFWANVDRSGGPTACWPWRRATDRDGYGVTGFYGDHPLAGPQRKRQWRANRIALGTRLDREPAGMACHTCDNRICCNPSHLYEGDAQTNQDDVIARGRRRDARRIADPDTIAEIGRLAASGMRYTDIGARLGVSDSVVSGVCRRDLGHPPRITSNRRRLRAIDYVLLADGLALGERPCILAPLFGVSSSHAARAGQSALARRMSGARDDG